MVSRREVLSGSGGVAVTLLAGCLGGDNFSVSSGTSTETEWSSPRGDTVNTGYVPDAKAPRESVHERWTISKGAATGTPAIVDGRVYLLTAGTLLALDVDQGNELWRFTLPGPTEPSSPIVYEGYVYTVSANNLYALDPETGTTQWSHTDDEQDYTALTVLTGEGVPSPQLVAGTTSGTMLGFALQTGERVWQKDLSSTISAFGFRAFVLFVGTDDGEVLAFYWKDTDVSPHDGWRSTVDGAVETMIPCSDGVAVHTTGGPLDVLQGGSSAGTTLWTIDSELASVSPIYTNPTFYTAGTEGFTAVREHDEQTEWQIDEQYDAVAPVAAGDTLYLSNGDTVHAFAADGGLGIGSIRTGAKRWSHSTPSGVRGLAIADGALFVACEGPDQTLYCLEPA